MLPILITTVTQQRYPTCGDYQVISTPWTAPTLSVTILEQENEDYEFLIAIHELVEWYITKKRGITEKEITDFDLWWEEHKHERNSDEPGNDELAPYKREHRFAENIERQIALELGVEWEVYNNLLNI